MNPTTNAKPGQIFWGAKLPTILQMLLTESRWVSVDAQIRELRQAQAELEEKLQDYEGCGSDFA